MEYDLVLTGVQADDDTHALHLGKLSERAGLLSVDVIWVVLDQIQGEPDDTYREIAGAGRELANRNGRKLCAVVIGSQLANLAEGLNHSGLDEVYLLDDPALENYSLSFTPRSYPALSSNVHPIRLTRHNTQQQRSCRKSFQ